MPLVHTARRVREHVVHTLAGRTLTASFHSDSASQVVRVIALALGAEVVQRGDTILLLPLSPDFTPKP